MKNVDIIMDEISEDKNLCIIRECLEKELDYPEIDNIMDDIYSDNSLCIIREALTNNL